MDNTEISKRYLKFREKALQYTNYDMNLQLENDKQVYLAVFDVPIETNIVGADTQTYALVFGLNTHLYFGNGDAMVVLEKNESVMKAMQSLLISSHQVLEKMQLTNEIKFYASKNIRAYLKTQKGIFFKEIIGDCKEDKFLLMLLNNVRKEISNALSK